MPIAALYRRIRAKVQSSDEETYLQARELRAQNRNASQLYKRSKVAESHSLQDGHNSDPNTTQIDPLTVPGTPNDAQVQPVVKIEVTNKVPDGAPVNIYTPSGSFPNANNPVFNGQVNMYDIMQSNQPVLQRLIEKGKPEAIHDSDSREYPPRCSENTRVSLRNDILEWRRNQNREKRIRWYMGPAGIGKSAIAQSVAEELERTGHLGGSFFFFRSAGINNPATVIPTLAYQLAMNNELYKQIVTRRLADDLLILNKNRSTQFKKLIIEPFQAISATHPSAIDDPTLIILDGLDECNGQVAQCELVQLILDHVGRVEKFPLLWLICSRPEWHLRTIVSDVDFPAACEKREIDVDDEEAQADARYLLETELAKIRNKYADYLPGDWPPTEDLDRLCRAASGHLGFASFVARFIGDPEADDPAGRFRICIRVVSGLGVDQGTRVNPLEALDRLYHRILSDVSPKILPVAMCILGFFSSFTRIYFGGDRRVGDTVLITLRTARDHASFLRLSQASYNGALKQLHSVVYVPTVNEASSQPLRFYHASFADFLSDPVRSGKFYLNDGIAWLEVAVQCLRWLRERSDQPSGDDRVSQFTRWAGWNASYRVPTELLPSLMEELASFDFGILRDPDPGVFTNFIHSLYTSVPSNNLLVRLANKPTETDLQTLVLKCEVSSDKLKRLASGFFPEDELKQPPFSLHFLLGGATQIHVHLTVTLEAQ